MTNHKTISQAMLALMPVLAIPTWICREGWEIMCIWAAGLAWSFFLRSWWMRVFMWLALLQLIWHPAAVSYKQFFMVAIFLGAAQVFSEIDPERILALIRIAALGLMGLMAFQLMGLIPVYTAYGKASGFFNPDAAGVFLALCMPAFFSGRVGWRGFYLPWPCFLPILFGWIWITECTTAMITAFAVIAVGLFLWGTDLRGQARMKGLLILTALIGANVVLWSRDIAGDIAGDPRWIVWQHTARTYESAPFGRGLGSFSQTFAFFTSSDARVGAGVSWQHAHNEYLQAGFEMGVHTLVFVGAFLVWTVASAWRRRRRLGTHGMAALAGIAGLCMSSLGWFTLHIAPLALVSMAWIGVWAGDTGKDRPGRDMRAW